MLHADRDQLFRVLMNLGRNAAQALAERRRPDLGRAPGSRATTS